MVNMKPPAAPAMVDVGGQLYRPEDVEAAEARLAAREAQAAGLIGAIDPTPIGVARSTDNRRQTLREQGLAGLGEGEEPFDPADTMLSREPVETELVSSDPVVDDSGDGEPAAKPARKRASSAGS